MLQPKTDGLAQIRVGQVCVHAIRYGYRDGCIGLPRFILDVYKRQVQDQSFFFYSNNYYVHHLIIERCREAGYMPRIGSTHAQSEFLLNVLDGENDMAILPRPFVRKQDTSDFCIVPFRPYLELSLIHI